MSLVDLEQTTLQEVIQAASKVFVRSLTAKLDVEILLVHILKISREKLYTNDRSLSSAEAEQFKTCIERRIKGEPIAYITGHREFWSLDLKVNESVLIPRPETELLIEIALTLFAPEEEIQCVDLGTGSGAIACALASERPHWQITATDQDAKALNLAQENAKRLQLNQIKFLQSHWYQQLSGQSFDLILSNPPYVALHDPYLKQGDVRFEPKAALVSDQMGFKDIRTIVSRANRYLKPNGYVVIEHGHQQDTTVRNIFEQAGFKNVVTYRDLAGIPRVTLGQREQL